MDLGVEAFGEFSEALAGDADLVGACRVVAGQVANEFYALADVLGHGSQFFDGAGDLHGHVADEVVGVGPVLQQNAALLGCML